MSEQITQKITSDMISNMWEEDSKLDKSNLHECALKTPMLHAKYLKIFMVEKRLLTALNIEKKQLKLVKYQWYLGKLSKDELTKLNWSQFDHKVLKGSDLEMYLDGDTDLLKLEARIENKKMILDQIEMILGQLKQRDFQIKNALTFMQFINGTTF